MTIIDEIDVAGSILEISCVDNDLLCDRCLNPFMELGEMLLKGWVVGHGCLNFDGGDFAFLLQEDIDFILVGVPIEIDSI